MLKSLKVDPEHTYSDAYEFCISTPDRSSTGCDAQLAMLVTSCVFVIITFFLFIRFLVQERSMMREPVYRIQILSLRMCTIFPLFSAISFLTFMLPKYFIVFESLYALAEGLCVYCFFKLIIYCAGTNDAIRELIKASKETGCLGSKIPLWRSCQAHPMCLSSINVIFLQFLFVRPLLILSAGIINLTYGYQAADETLPNLFRFFVVSSIISLVITLPAVVRVYEMIGKSRPEISPLKKAVFVKLVILICVIQFSVVNIISSGYHYSEKDLLNRKIAFCILMEMFGGSVICPYIFTSTPELLRRIDAETGHNNFSKNMEIPPVGTYLYQVVALWMFLFDSNNKPAYSLFVEPGAQGVSVVSIEVGPKSDKSADSDYGEHKDMAGASGLDQDCVSDDEYDSDHSAYA